MCNKDTMKHRKETKCLRRKKKKKKSITLELKSPLLHNSNIHKELLVYINLLKTNFGIRMKTF